MEKFLDVPIIHIKPKKNILFFKIYRKGDENYGKLFDSEGERIKAPNWVRAEYDSDGELVVTCSSELSVLEFPQGPGYNKKDLRTEIYAKCKELGFLPPIFNDMRVDEEEEEKKRKEREREKEKKEVKRQAR
jgi:hypothetical protein